MSLLKCYSKSTVFWDCLVVWCKFADLSFSRKVSKFFFSKPRGNISKKTPAVLVIAVRSVKLTISTVFPQLYFWTPVTSHFHSISSALLLNSCHLPFFGLVNEQQVQNTCFAFRSKALGIPGLFTSPVCVHVLPTAQKLAERILVNPLNPKLNSICYLLALLGAHHFLHVSRIRVKSLTLRRLMSYICGAPILDVSRSHTTTQHSR